jgi:hypothetical protein
MHICGKELVCYLLLPELIKRVPNDHCSCFRTIEILPSATVLPALTTFFLLYSESMGQGTDVCRVSSFES